MDLTQIIPASSAGARSLRLSGVYLSVQSQFALSIGSGVPDHLHRAERAVQDRMLGAVLNSPKSGHYIAK